MLVDTLSSQQKMVAVGVGLAGAAFVGYCIYFDRKRHADPNFKKKLREKRLKSQEVRTAGRGGGGDDASLRMPDINNPTEMQAFFLQEVQLGEELMAEGNVEQGVEHLCNAITMCGQPQQLIQILQQTLPPEAFSLMIQKLPEAGTRMARVMGGRGGGGGGGGEAGLGMGMGMGGMPGMGGGPEVEELVDDVE